MAGKSTSKSFDGGGIKHVEIDDLLSYLELNDDELDDVVIGVEETKIYQKDARWMAIRIVLTDRSFRSESLFEKMKSI